MPKKQCRKCGKWKPVEDFHAHHKSKDGRTHVCKGCKPRKPSWISAEFKHPKRYFAEQKAKTDGELLKVNQELIEVCQGYKQEISKLSEVIDSQKQTLDSQGKKH